MGYNIYRYYWMFIYNNNAIDIDASLRRFWELKDVNQEFHGKPEDDEVEQHFVKSHTRDSKGRYIVELPFKNSKEQFSDTLQGALTRFRGVERRLKKTPICTHSTCNLCVSIFS